MSNRIIWECTKHGVKRHGESCNLNNNCKFPSCLQQTVLDSEEIKQKVASYFGFTFEEMNTDNKDMVEQTLKAINL